MRYLIMACLFVFAVYVVVIATADDAELATLDPFRPTTILPIVATRVQKLPALVRDLVDGFTAPHRARAERRTTLLPEPR